MIDQLIGGFIGVSGKLTILCLGGTVPHSVIAVSKSPRRCRDRQRIAADSAGLALNYPYLSI